MPDREKVIGLLQEMAEYFRDCRSNASFASKAENHFWELQNAANEAVELLKEQEPQKVINRYVNWNFELKGNCPKCNAVLYEFDNAKACGVCGQAVKWDE